MMKLKYMVNFFQISDSFTTCLKNVTRQTDSSKIIIVLQDKTFNIIKTDLSKVPEAARLSCSGQDPVLAMLTDILWRCPPRRYLRLEDPEISRLFHCPPALASRL